MPAPRSPIAFINPREREKEQMREEVEKTLAEIRPHLQLDGGDIELIEAEGGVVKVRLTGACGGCPMATLTLKNYVEKRLRETVPAIKEVIAV
jgi:Fe-S cluster biogenesis protein NfuA